MILKNFINNEFIYGRNEYIDDICPSTGDVIAKIPRSNKTEVEAAVKAADSAKKGWAKRSVKERAAFLNRIADCIEERKQELAEMESRDQGKPVALAAAVDIPRAIDNFRFFAMLIQTESMSCHHMNDAINYTQRVPYGIVGLITPWNLPLYLLTWKVAPAIAAGNCVIAKPSELTPLTANALAECVLKAGLPAGVVNILQGTGPEVGQAIVEHPDITCISFTGGTSTGKRIAAIAAPMFKRTSLELGGKNATVVFDDADMKEAIPIAVRAAFANQGEICLCGSRVFVHERVYDDFLEGFLNETKRITVGDPKCCKMGALNSFQHREKVEGYIRLAIEEGGTIAFGGKRPDLPKPFDKGAFLEPTIITGLSYKSRTATEEIFGPVVTIHKFGTDEEVVEMVNHTRYGLAGSVWSRDNRRAHKIAQAIDSGMIWVNCWLYRDLRVPFGGMKASGMEREGGVLSLEAYSEKKNICIRFGSAI